MLKINTSSFGNIYKVYEKDSNPYIIKNVPFYNGVVPNLLEIILYFTQCPNLIQAFDYKICDNYYSLSMPIAKCDLSKIYIKKIKFDIFDLILQICLGVKFLHDRNIVHGDIKPENILIFRNKNKTIAKVSDFSLSSFCFGEHIENKNAYTIGYRAPELINKGYYNFASDIWALGQTLKTFSFDFDLKSKPEAEIKTEILRNVIYSMTLENPNERWSIDQVIDYLSFKYKNFEKNKPYDFKIFGLENSLYNLIENTVYNNTLSNKIFNKMCRKINYTDLYESKQEIAHFDSLFKNILTIL